MVSMAGKMSLIDTLHMSKLLAEQRYLEVLQSLATDKEEYLEIECRHIICINQQDEINIKYK